MAAIRDIVKSVDQSTEASAETKETLKILMDMVEAKAELFENQIDNNLITGKTIDNLNVPITKVISRKKEYRAVTSNRSDIIEEIGRSFSELFAGDESVIKSISSIVGKAFQAMMGVGKGQEGVSEMYEVIAEYPAIVRFDFKFWYRNIESESIFKYMENVFAVTAVKSVVDTSKLSFHDFIALYGPVLKEAFGDDKTKIKAFLGDAKEIYNLFQGGDLHNAGDLIQDYIDNSSVFYSVKSKPFTLTQSRVIESYS
ncbi:hypothetical protein [Yersinia rohdei]|uniref:hypothetical protein n=1 Tax=Yersinia rohdei TaxID=29485 RepID=UPI0011A80CF5|nr:hypothetical protein [Yersinia rohdei]